MRTQRTFLKPAKATQNDIIISLQELPNGWFLFNQQTKNQQQEKSVGMDLTISQTIFQNFDSLESI